MKKAIDIVLKVVLSIILVMPILGLLGVFPPPTQDLYNTPQAFEFIETITAGRYITIIMVLVHIVALACLWTRRTALAALLILPITVNVVGIPCVPRRRLADRRSRARQRHAARSTRTSSGSTGSEYASLLAQRHRAHRDRMSSACAAQRVRRGGVVRSPSVYSGSARVRLRDEQRVGGMHARDELAVAVRPTVADRLRRPRVHAPHVVDVPIRQRRARRGVADGRLGRGQRDG